MNLDDWLIVPRFADWQSRRDRRDPWIKSYIDQLDRDEYRSMSFACRGLLESIRLIFARMDGQIRTRQLQGVLGQRVYMRHLERLSDAGFIAFSAAKPPPLSGAIAARAREEVEVEVDKDIPLPPSSKEPQNHRSTNGRRSARDAALEQAQRLIRNGYYQLTEASLADELRGRAVPEDAIPDLLAIAAELRHDDDIPLA